MSTKVELTQVDLEVIETALGIMLSDIVDREDKSNDDNLLLNLQIAKRIVSRARDKISDCLEDE